MITTDDLFLEITDGSTTGTGYFDRLMKSTYGHINEMFMANNLSGTEKANVYMQALTTVLQTSTQFALNAQIQQYQIEGIIKDNLVKDQQILESVFNVTNMLPKELEKITSEIVAVQTTSYIQRLEEGHKLATVARVTLDKVAPVITEFNLDTPVGA